jgi:ATP-dependent Zn protease
MSSTAITSAPTTIIKTNMDKLEAMSEALIKYETIDEEQIKDIMEGKTAPSAARLGRYADAHAARTLG